MDMNLRLYLYIMELSLFCFLILFTEGRSRLCSSHVVRDLVNQQCRSHLLWSIILRSKLECYVRCHGDRRCFSFQYKKSTKQCQGHYKRLPNDDCKSKPGFQTYLMCGRGTAVGAKCATDYDCTRPRTICTNQICWCRPGYQYSPRRHLCVKKCRTYADTFQILPNTTTRGYDDLIMTYKTSTSECLDVCKRITRFTCRSIDINPFKNTCYLGAKSQMMAPKRRRQFNEYYSYQRECAP